MTKHATLSPSAAHRWMSCPGSVRMSAGIPRKSSPDAALGTAAHKLGEICLREGKDAKPFIGTIIDTETDGSWEVTKEMAECVQHYLDEVLRLQKILGGVLHVEERLDLTALVPDMFGTADAVIVSTDDETVEEEEF